VLNPTASNEIPDDTDDKTLWGEIAQLNVTVIDAGTALEMTLWT